MDIRDYEKIVEFGDCSEFDIEIEKSAAFKDSIRVFRKKLPMDMVNVASGRSIEKYEDKNKALNKKINRYPAATEPAAPNSRGKVSENIKKLQKNLEIVFTPFSVIITAKSGGKKLTIQTIDVIKMSGEMRTAWQNKNADYFKKYMSTKMEYSAQLAKQRFILDGIKSSIDFQEDFSKNASELCEEYDEEIPFFNVLFYGEKYAEIDEDIFEKLANVSCVNDTINIITPTDNNDAFLEICASCNAIPDVVDEDFYKEASLVITPEYVKKNAKIIFLTDRVVLVADNKVLTSLLAEDMSSDMYSAFLSKDKEYFKKLFERQATIYEQRRVYYGNSDGIKKKASVSKSLFSLSGVFTLDFIHPFIYYNILNKKLGKDWISYDEFVIIKEIEDKFKTPVICNSALNKVLSISAINSNQTDLAFTSIHAFEKIIRSFCDLPIDFEQRETDSLDSKNIMFGLECMSMCCKSGSIYSKLGPDVCSYIVDLLVSDNMYAFYPKPNEYTKDIPEEQLEFLSRINRSLLESIIKRDNDAILDSELEAETAKNDEIIQAATIGSLDFMRNGEAQSVQDVEGFVKMFCARAGVEDRFVEISKKQVQKNFEIDTFLRNKFDTLKVYLNLYGIN